VQWGPAAAYQERTKGVSGVNRGLPGWGGYGAGGAGQPRLADAHEFISRLPGGYGSKIGRDGCTLSSGQRRGWRCARALFHDPSILVLDEPTSALDNLSRRAARGALHKLMAGRTVSLLRWDAIQAWGRAVLKSAILLSWAHA